MSGPEHTAASFLGPDGPFARIGTGWEARTSQARMAEAVEATFADGGHLVVEAPTGVGKTLGYLVPAAFAGRRVIVSTHTKTLQDQLVDKDLPRLAAALAEVDIDLRRASPRGTGPGGDLRYALMKGRANYLCFERLGKRTRQRSLAFAPRGQDTSELSDADLLREIDEWSGETERGDRAELPGLPERSALWDAIDARSETCLGSSCAHFERCFVTRMREEGDAAEIVVVNHHLLLADMALKARAELAGEHARFGQVLPDADLLVVDEAHTLEAIAAEHFGGVFGYSKVERLLKDAMALDEAEPLGSGLSTRLLQATARAQAAVAAVFAELPSGEGRVQLAGGASAGLRAAGRRGSEALHQLSAVLEDIPGPAAAGLARRTGELAEGTSFVLGGEDPDYVYWTEGQGPKGRLGASPVDVARLLERFLFGRFEATLTTSATLSVGNDEACDYFRRSVGLSDDNSRALVLESNFHYPTQAALLVPEQAPEPGAPGAEALMAELTEAAIRAVGGGALVLCTSHRGMRAMYARLSKRLPYPVAMQGQRPKRALIAQLIEQAPAVLVATQSFWEGVDVPGDPLRLVVMDRLPFDVPTDPLVMARATRLEAAGKSAFAHDQLPRAILRLKQGFGRLIRSRSDRGAVVLLDGRVLSRGYGRRFLSALPPAQRLHHIEGLEAWWAERS